MVGVVDFATEMSKAKDTTSQLWNHAEHVVVSMHCRRWDSFRKSRLGTTGRRCIMARVDANVIASARAAISSSVGRWHTPP
jgi:hypothetical protein